MSTTQTRRDQISVYFLSAPEDEAVCEALREHLAPVIRSSEIPISVESDFQIEGGAVIADQEQKLLAADIVLALISVDFINDDHVYERNQRVIERHNAGRTVMIPILVRNCLWKLTPFGKQPLLAKLLPKCVQPLNNKQYWNSVDDALTAVVEDIYESIADVSVGFADRGASDDRSPSAGPPNESLDLPPPAVPGLPAPAPGLPPPATPGSRLPASQGPAHASPSAQDSGWPATTTHAVAAKVDVDWREGYYRRVVRKRAFALLFDFFLVFFLPLFITGMILSAAGSDSDSASDTGAAIALGVGAFLFYVVSPIFEASSMKGTIGKRIMKIEITERNGDRVSFVRAFVRNILRTAVLYSYVLIVPLVIQIFTFRRYKKLFHDQLSSTVIGEKLGS